MTINSKKDIQNIVKEFADSICGSGSRADKCFVVCSSVVAYLRFLEIKGYNLIEGCIVDGLCEWLHFWIGCQDGSIIDPTASQFNELLGKHLPDFYVGEKPDWYKIKQECNS